jgi:glucose/arabinose dehydrogenase
MICYTPLRPWSLAASVVAIFATISPINALSSCSNHLQPVNGIKPSVASGYTWAVVATGLTSPRSLQFDDTGNLWVLESGKGASRHTVVDNGGVCVGLKDGSTVVSDSALNHGMFVDQSRIIVSSTEMVYQVSRYSSRVAAIASNSKKILITNMTGSDHVTRTLLMAEGTSNSLIVSRGSFANIDPQAAQNGTGHSTVKMFDISKVGGNPYDYDSSGTLLGWGLRNDVGLAQHPATSGLYTVENSVDDLERNGVDVHENNPGEEMNFLGVVHPSSMKSFRAKNFGYPYCLSAWKPKDLPANAHLHVGSPFAQNSSDDAACVANTEPARLTFQAHMAPIDIKFNNSGTQAWVSFHGSWDRDPPGECLRDIV